VSYSEHKVGEKLKGGLPNNKKRKSIRSQTKKQL
jgi:hypothetical protein